MGINDWIKEMINFIKKRRLWYSISILVICIGIIFMGTNINKINHIFNLGIDFTGGTSISIRFNEPVQNYEIKLREILISEGLEKHVIQQTGNGDIILKTNQINVETRNILFEKINKQISTFELLEIDIIGPSIGEELKQSSMIIILTISIAILLYCSWRFELIFGVASIIALLHDALILLAVSAIFKIEINTAYVAALLTVLGYSINDTIVIFDRIRESIKKELDGDEAQISKSLINKAVNDMIPRSIHTSLTTGLVIISLYIFGGVSLKVFALVLIIGLISGTYSSLFIASPMIVTISKLRGIPIVK